MKELIRSGNAVEGFYENKMLKKKLKLWRPIKLGDELEEIFRKLMIKIPGFDVKESINKISKKKVKLKIGMIQVLQTYGADMKYEGWRKKWQYRLLSHVPEKNFKINTHHRMLHKFGTTVIRH